MARRGWVVLGLAGAVVAAGALMAWRSRDALVANVGGALFGTLQPRGVKTKPVERQEPFTVLVISNENQPGYAGPALTDSMMVLSFDPQQREVSIISVPRDLWVDIPSEGYQRINTAYENGGAQIAELTVEKYIGVPIEYYAVVDYTALINLVNAVGGVNVVVPPGVTGRGIYDPTYPNAAENGYDPFILAKGPQHLDGAQALKFSRERHSFADGDIQRERDQQMILLSLRHQMLQPANIFRLPQIVHDLQSLVTTDVPYSAVPGLAEAVLKVPKANIKTGVLDYSSGAVSNYTTSGGAEVLLPHAAAIHSVVTATFPALLAHMGKLSVQVENGAPTNLPLAGDFSTILDGMGVNTLPAMQADRTNYQHNHVYVNTAALQLRRGQPLPTEAYILAQMLDVTPRVTSDPASSAQIVVILGSSFPHL